VADIMRAPVIEGWKANGQLLTGKAVGHPTYPDGTVLTTSEVVFVALVGPMRLPIAYTRSGSLYRLGEPDPSFGEDNAQAFVLANAQAGTHQHKVQETIPETRLPT
jgi:hypothetical protein